MKRFRIVKVLGMLVIVSVVFTGVSFLVMQLWNNVLAAVVHVGQVTFWQAAGLLLLSKILFGFGGKHFGRRGDPRDHAWRKEMIGKWKNMTPEERKKFKDDFKQRCRGGWHGNPMWREEFKRPEETRQDAE